LVNSVERRETLEESSPNLQRRWSLEQPGDQTWQGRILFVLFSIFRVLERQSYLLSLLAMLVKTLQMNINFLLNQLNLGMEYNIS
jgi:hypothetical protein